MLGAELDLFGGAIVKKNLQGQYVPIGPKELAGVSVALYFGKKNHPKCAAVASILKQFYLTTNCSYGPMNVEIIYVSLDEDEKTFEHARATMPWCSVVYNSDLRKNLISRYRISDNITALHMAGFTSTECPHIIVIGPNGEEAGRLDISKGGPEAFLLNWDYRYNRWPGTAAAPSSVVTWT